jgi:transcriptional regulator NrdR family protein
MVPAVTESNPKECPHCGSGSNCYDSRQMDGYVRRNYRCTGNCGARWMTAEFMIDKGPVLKPGRHKVEDFMGNLTGKFTRQAVERAMDTLRTLL